MGQLLTIITVVFVFWLLWPTIRKWLSRIMANRAEDMFRRMMGMPTRKEQRRQERRQAAAAGRRGRGGNSSQGRGRRAAYAGDGAYADGRTTEDPAAMMKSVAEDVEYTEYVEYESTEIAEDDGKTTRIVREEQVSDVEYVEIKKKTT